MMANLWRGCACTIPCCTQKALMGRRTQYSSTVTPEEEGALRRVLHNTIRRMERKKEKKLLSFS